MKMLKNKKGIVEQLHPLIIALTTIVIILTVGFLIMDEGKSVVKDKINSATSTNESVTYPGANTVVALTNSPASIELSCGAVYVANSSGSNYLVGSGNYTCNQTGIYFQNGTIGGEDGGDTNAVWNVTYTYKLGDYAWNATRDTQNATQDIPTWLPIIVITVIGSLLIGLVSLFRRK